MNQPQPKSVNSIPASQSQSSVKKVNWRAKYEKEHNRKKKLNKKKKKAYKRIKQLTKQNQELKDQLAKLKTASFIHEHDYF